jgi:hypothetical protein
LPEAAWWDDYYTPMQQQLVSLRGKYTGQQQALAVLDECQLEIDYYRDYSQYYGYEFIVAQVDKFTGMANR